MWLWLLAGVLSFNLNLGHAKSTEPPSSRGPISDSEAQILLTQGQKALQEKRYQDSINFLQRYIDRYPGKPDYFKSHLFLGEARLRLNDPNKAIPLFQTVIATSKAPQETLRARLLLGQAYLAVHKYQEAYQTSLEVDDMKLSQDLHSNFLMTSLLNKVEAFTGLHQYTKAEEAILDAEKKMTFENDDEVRSRTYAWLLKIKTWRCSQFPGKGPITEDQAADQIRRRGSCLLEALLNYRELLKIQDQVQIEFASKQFVEAIQGYSQACSNAPAPADRKPRTLAETQKYRSELRELLVRECAAKASQGVEILESWPETSGSEKHSPTGKIYNALRELQARSR